MFGLFERSVESATRRAFVPEDSRVYAIGDIHGSLDQLKALHALIEADAAESAIGRKVVIYVGDYIDRGADSRGVIDLLIEAPLPGFECVHLIGNHEFMMREFLEDSDATRIWLMNGGDATLHSFGVDAYANAPGDPPLREQLQDVMTEAELAFLTGLRWNHVEGDYYFAHAGIRPGIELGAQDEHDLIWIRDPFLSSDQDFGKVVVHGHTPVRAPERRSNRIGIDTGAVYGGQLTALVLDADNQRFLQV